MLVGWPFQISQLTPQNVSNLAWAIAKVWLKDSAAGAIVESLKNRLGEFQARHLANTAWVFATIRRVDLPVMAAVAESFIRAGPEGALPQDVANTLWALAKVALLHRRFLQMVGKAMCARLWEYDQQNLSNILWSFAALAVLDRPLVALATSAVAEGPLRPQTLSNTAWALATLEMLDVALMERLGERSLQVMGEFKVQELVNTAWAFATSALITLPLLAALAKAARRWPVEALQPQDIAGLAWSLAVCSFPDPSLFDAFAACSLEGFGPQDLANTAWAFAAARVQAGPLMRRIGEASALQIAHFDAQDLANAMWAFAKLEERPPERLWCSWPDQVFQTLQEATLQNLAMTTWSIATLGSPTPALLALMPKVAAEAALRLVGKRILPNRSALQEISNLLWSFPTLELSIPEELLTISEQHLQKTLPQQLAQVLCQVQKETAQEPQEAFDFATSILELTWALAFSGDGDGPRGALLTLLRNTLMEVAEALDRTSQWWLRRLDSSRSSGRFWPESGRTCDEELPRREELEWPVLQLNLPEVAVVLKPPYWEVDAHAPTTAPDATAPHDAKLSSFLQGVEGWEDFPLIFSEEHQFGILHRLDLPSSGLILVGKTFRGYFSLRWQQDTYDLGRNYLVLCHGVVEEQVVNARLKTTKSNPVSSCVSASGKPAWTHFQPLLLLSRGTEKYTLLIVVIRTGRTHQIRVHAQHIGHPTVADTKYGGALAAEDLRWCPRNFLHRFQLRFQDPAGRPHTASAPLPGDLRAALARLRAEGAEEMWRKLLDGWIP